MNNIADDLVSAYNSGYAEGKRDAVRHGKWEEEQAECYGLPSTNYVCPECGAWFDGTFMAACMGGVEDEGILFPRCPSCGCVMDGKESRE